MQYIYKNDLFFAGQITGVEGYLGNIATGFLAGVNAARVLMGEPLLELPPTTIIGALCNYITQADAKGFQPMKANMGILLELGSVVKDKKMRALAYADRSEMELWKILEGRNDNCA
jgi:methylenetetrahydrofolate--tRNA-(uracil-5-)-methyltransferase